METVFESNVYWGTPKKWSLVQWLTDWWKESFYGIMAILFVAFVVVPILSTTEERVKDGARFMSEQELRDGVTALSALIKDPMRGGKDRYFEILYAYSDLDAQCYATQFGSRNGYISGYRLAQADNPCMRLTGKVKFAYDTYTMTHQHEISAKAFDSLSAGYHDMHPTRKLDNYLNKAGIMETVNHPEKWREAYWNGVAWAFVWFLFRIKRKECRLGWEAATLRFPCMIFAWPVTFWFYPGDPIEQAKEIRRWIGYIFSFVTSFTLGSIGARAETKDWEFSGGASAQSNYTYDNAKVANDGWVIQSWAQVMHTPSGLYASVWGSVGFEKNDGNEIDFTAGFKKSLFGVNWNLSYNFYDFTTLGQGVHAPKLSACVEKFSICGKFTYLIPDTGAPSGIQTGIWWTHSWTSYKIGTLVGATYTGEVFGRKPVTVLKAEVSVLIAKTGIEVFARGYLPVLGGQADNDSPTGMIGLRFAF